MPQTAPSSQRGEASTAAHGARCPGASLGPRGEECGKVVPSLSRAAGLREWAAAPSLPPSLAAAFRGPRRTPTLPTLPRLPALSPTAASPPQHAQSHQVIIFNTCCPRVAALVGMTLGSSHPLKRLRRPAPASWPHPEHSSPTPPVLSRLCLQTIEVRFS